MNIFKEPEYIKLNELRRRVLKDGNNTVVLTRAYCDDLTGLESEAGTTGSMGGDWGHGSRVYLRLSKGEGSWRVTANEENIEIILGGDWELDAIKGALLSMLRALESQSETKEELGIIDKLIGLNEDKKIEIENLKRELAEFRQF